MKILVVARTLKQGEGISEWISNYYGELVKKPNVHIDLLIEEQQSDFNFSAIPEGVNLIKIHEMKTNLIRYIYDWFSLSKIVESKYDFVHIHLDNYVRFFYLIFLRNKKNIILHSHNSYNEEVSKNKIKTLFHKIGKFIVKHGNYIHFSCSDLAAKWLFGNADYVQINNGIDLSHFKFNEEIREEYQKKFQIKGKTVYGHVGRFMYQKNHEKLIEVFNKIHESNLNSVLILIGDGPNRPKIESMVADFGIQDSVYFLGYRSDVDKILNAMDFIIFPSRFEGLPMALVEAQANGIPVMYSDGITNEIRLLESSMPFSIEDSATNIARKAVNIKSLKNRESAVNVLKRKGYDRRDVIQKLYIFYSKGGLK